MFNQLYYGADSTLKQDVNYEYIMAYAADYVSGYAEIELTGINKHENLSINQLSIENKNGLSQALLYKLN